MLGFGPFQLCLDREELRRDGQPLALRTSALRILRALAEHPGEVVSKRRLCELAWPEREVDENNLQVDISALRKLLGRQAIATASGRGYQFALAVQRLDGAASPLFGRSAELAALPALLVPGALLSLVGEGGIGKTRLARALMAAVPRAAFVDLADGPGALDAIGQALACSGRRVADLAQALAAWPGLLVLDGCEAAMQPVAELIAALPAGPAVTLLATSREVLRVPGEQVVRLGPLPEAAALEMLEQRLQGHPHGMDPAALATLCAQLDGLPLAIELAAAQVGAQRQPDATVPVRHRSLGASFQASWQALNGAEQQWLSALARLPTPFGLDDVLTLQEATSAAAWAGVDALARLVDQSLVLVEPVEPPRYRLTATTRRCLQA